MYRILLILTISLIGHSCRSQEPLKSTVMPEAPSTALPYDTIPAYADAYSAGAVCARLVDGLGFRYRWATEGLRQADLDYKIDSTNRTSMETLSHIQGLSETLLNSVMKEPNIRPRPEAEALSWEDMRAATLHNFLKASTILSTSTEEDLASYEVVFKRGDRENRFPFWHQLNGPIADALWHVGQVVSFRRASGNPIDSRVNVFMGRVRER